MPATKPLKIGDGGAHEQFAATDTLPIANLDVASQAEAEAGVVSDKVMTPLRTAQAITAQGGGGGGISEDLAIVYSLIF
ncbi:hypothetical protein UFOVP1492_117 [uncultured Caudovirales phage]|uniref:Uncharacterized protein n=1 Tax=uncultured Caudovirales phage TaxID=2100421 RepID=A0A6J7XL21_9CAUD|nr:hypothetical protein UFOVP1127_17 [uncultured Caudovirales phage]CAB4193307.1 hypothetical protein UFOVP1242_57 [uncultured Caudovirales phage]CAB4217885.1 hypothetical protein UFOVP1492_117 [uncultured Caudovirales phage]CAB5231004.1 hypothetical protein UFOVP1580_10 [uncultured Caudovirales phage]